MKKKQYSFLFALILLCTLPLSGDPWGKNSDLIGFKKKIECESVIQRSSEPSLVTRMGLKAIRFHQNVISPADGPRSHFIPSSSQYTYEAMQKYGFLQGFTMGCDRLMRENDDPWVYRKIKAGGGQLMKWDPVK